MPSILRPGLINTLARQPAAESITTLPSLLVAALS